MSTKNEIRAAIAASYAACTQDEMRAARRALNELSIPDHLQLDNDDAEDLVSLALKELNCRILVPVLASDIDYMRLLLHIGDTNAVLSLLRSLLKK